MLEPNPAGGSAAWLVTTYTYNSLNQLTQVTMARSTATQVRTFQYTGTDLTGATNPENGTVTYQYDAGHHVTLRTDAKGQQTQYTYDSYGRLTLVQHYTPSAQGPVEQALQDVNYYYDSNPFDSTYSQNAWGRLTAVGFAQGWQAGNTVAPNLVYMYGYNQAGRVTAQRLRSVFHPPSGGAPVNTDFNATYAWDNQGRMTSLGYPFNGPAYTYQFDAMGRLSGMNENGTAMASTTYNSLGQLSQMTYDNVTETRTYNALMQLEHLYTTQTNGVAWMDMLYYYTAGKNNGRLAQSIDSVGGETLNYTYDVLNRLSTVRPRRGHGRRPIHTMGSAISRVLTVRR